MARARKFTDQEVIDAVEALNLAGKTINGTNLRSQVGQGRPDALMKVYEQLVDAGSIIQAQHPTLSDVELSAEIQRKLIDVTNTVTKIVTAINNEAHRIAERHFMDMVKGAEARASDAESKIQRMSEDMAKAFDETEDAKEALDALTEKFNLINNELEEDKLQLKDSLVALKIAEERISELQEKVSEKDKILDSQHHELVSLRSQVDKLHTELIQAKEESAKIRQALEVNKNDYAQLKKDLDKVSEERDQYALEAKNINHAYIVAESELAELNKRELQLSKELEETTEILNRTRERAGRAEGTAEAYKSHNEELTREIVSQREKNWIIESNLVNANEKLKSMQEKLEKANDEIKTLQLDIKKMKENNPIR